MPVTAPLPAPGPGTSDRRPLWLGLIALAAILVAALALAAVVLTLRHRPAGGTGRSAPHAVSAPRDGHRQARLDLVGGVSVVTVRSADLGGDLYRIGTPEGSGQVPRVADRDSSVLVSVDSVGGGGPAALQVLISSAVTWQFRLGGGAGAARIDLRAGPVAGVDIASGVSGVELWLPRPVGTVPVREAGGAGSFTVHLPPGVPVRARLADGAGSATIDGATRSGLSGGTELTGGADRGGDQGATPAGGYDLDAAGGLSALRVDRY